MAICVLCGYAIGCGTGAEVERVGHRERPADGPQAPVEACVTIGSQTPLSEKIKVAHYVIDGTLPIEQLRKEVTRIYQLLKQLA